MAQAMNLVTISELKKSPATVIDRAKADGKPIGILKNNEVQGYFVPVGAFELVIADSVDVRNAVDQVIDEYGDAIKWLADK